MGQSENLRKIIVEEFGERLLQLVDPVEEGWILPIGESSIDGVVETLKEINFYDVLIKGVSPITGEIEQKKEELVKGRYDANDDVVLAARIDRHDLGDHNLVLGMTSYNILKRSKQDKDTVNMFIIDLINFRSFGLEMAYIASGGDQRFDSEIPSFMVEHLFSSHYDKDITTKNNLAGNISSQTYCSAYRLVGNADGNIVVTLDKENGWQKVSIRDNYTGIVDINGKPLSKEKIPDIFYELTTREYGGWVDWDIYGEGVDLDVVRRKLELKYEGKGLRGTIAKKLFGLRRKEDKRVIDEIMQKTLGKLIRNEDYVELLTKRKEMPVIRYDTRDGRNGKCVEVKTPTPLDNVESGSIFTIYTFS